MAKQSKGKKAEKAVGKGKVTPVQIAFIVDRYLTDNNYTTTLSAFRTEADNLFSRTKGKEAPKGLMGLRDILEEYICLKEQRVMVDQEKRRVEMALQGMQGVMRAYHASAGGATLPPLPSSPPLLPPQVLATPLPPSFLPSNPSSGSPSSGRTTLINYSKPPIFQLKAAGPNKFATPVPKFSSANKRKASKSAPKVPPAPKKPRTQPPTHSSMIEGKTSPSQVTSTDNTEQDKGSLSAVQSISIKDPMVGSPVQGSSVAKSLFKQPPEPRVNSTSPKTPPQTFPSEADKSVSTLEDSSFRSTDAAALREITSANCSIVSSQTVIVSPLKRTGYYSIERSYHVTSSPFKSTPKKVGKREHVKGKLHFDEPDLLMSFQGPAATNCSTPSTDGETPGTYDYDLPDLDIFNGEISFSELLADIDLDCEGMPLTCRPTSTTDFIRGSEHDEDDGCLLTHQALSGPCMSKVTSFLSTADMNIEGPDSVTSLRAITKRVKILSPAKTRSNCSPEKPSSPAKK